MCLQKVQTLQSSGQEEKRKKIGKEIGMMRWRNVGGMKALRWVLLWILIGVNMQNGGSCGGGNPTTPRNGTHARNGSRFPRGKHGKMEDDGLLTLAKRKKKQPGKGPKDLSRKQPGEGP